MLLTPARPEAALPRTIERSRLTDAQAHLLHRALTDLGIDAGVIEDRPPVADPARRTLISDFAASALGLQVTPGHEIAQCAMCLDVMDGALAHDEDDGYIRCGWCREEWQSGYDSGPDTTAEACDWAA